MVVFILLILAAGLAALAQRQSGKIKRLNTRLRPIDNLITQLDPQPPCLACTVVHSY
jgi:hypothetical protein